MVIILLYGDFEGCPVQELDFSDLCGSLTTQEHKVLTHLYSNAAPQPPEQTQLKMWCPHTSTVRNQSLSHVRANPSSTTSKRADQQQALRAAWLDPIPNCSLSRNLLQAQEMLPDTPNPPRESCAFNTNIRFPTDTCQHGPKPN